MSTVGIVGCFFQSSLHQCKATKKQQQKTSLTGSKCTNSYFTFGEGYTDRDIAAKLRCCKTAVHNVSNIRFNADDRKRSDRPHKTMH